MFGMKKRVFLVEQFIQTLLVIRVFMTHLFSLQLYLAIIGILIVTQFYKQGLTPKILLLIPIISLQVFAELNQSTQLQYIAAMLGSVLHFLPLKLYWLPQPKKLVGFKQDSIDNGLHYIEFYPLDQSKQIFEKSMKWNQQLQIAKMLLYARISNKLLKKVGHAIMSFADRLQIKVGEGSEKNTSNSLAFCHGRGGTPLIYSSFLMYFASLGFKVGAVQHSEVNETNLKQRQEIKKYREKEVQVRAAQYYQAIAKVDNQNIVLAGHSYGCATIIQAYQSLQTELKSKIRSIILLDPWLFPLNQKTFSKKIDCPVLILANQDFITYQDMYERNQKFLQQHKTDKIEYIVWKNAHHLHQTDIGFIAGNSPTICKYSHLSNILLQLNFEAINKFLKDDKLEGTFGQNDLGRNYKPKVFHPPENFIF